MRADQLRGPVDEGETVRKGSRVRLDGRTYLVVSKRVNERNGFVNLGFAWIPTNPMESFRQVGGEECSPDKLFDEVKA